MATVLDRIQWGEAPTVGPQRVPIATVLEQLETSPTAPEAGPAFHGLDWADLVAVLASALGPASNTGPALVQARPARPGLAAAIERVVAARRTQGSTGLVLAAALYQVNDFWEASHEAAQEADDRGDPSRLGALWHAIAHRREPDAGNAAYWFRRAGKDPAGIYSALARVVPDLTTVARPGWYARVLGGSNLWDPIGFIEACGLARNAGRDSEHFARLCQRHEMELALDAAFEAAR